METSFELKSLSPFPTVITITLRTSPKQVLPLRVRVDLGVMRMKSYFTLFRAPELVPHLQIQFSIISIQLFLF